MARSDPGPARSPNAHAVARRACLMAPVALALGGGAVSAGEKDLPSYTSGGAAIPYEVFRPAAGSRGVVMLLHGADGLQMAPLRRWYEEIARALAGAGWVTLFPHYFARTGTGRAAHSGIFRNFPDWQAAVVDGIAPALALDPGRRELGLVGISLGAGLALSVAGTDARVAAVVEMMGMLPPQLIAAAPRFPPTLVLHGARDPIVPVAAAHGIEQALKRRGTPHEVKVYPDEGHGFTAAALADAEARVGRFLAAYLGG